jgi:hypothetical protein
MQEKKVETQFPNYLVTYRLTLSMTYGNIQALNVAHKRLSSQNENKFTRLFFPILKWQSKISILQKKVYGILSPSHYVVGGISGWMNCDAT